MNEKALKTLEYNKILLVLKDKASSENAKELISSLKPYNNIIDIRKAQCETSEAVSMLLKKGSPNFGGLRDISAYIKRTAVFGSLSAGELLHIADFLRTSSLLKSYARENEKEEEHPLLTELFDSIETASELQREIENCIISPTEIADDASTALREIRREIKIANERIRAQLNSVLHSQSYKNMLQEAVITIRNDRYCVPVKQEYKNAFSGMIHDQSSTGATVFIEPIGVVQLNNKITELHAKEKAEIDRILARLSGEVNQKGELLLSNMKILTKLDFIFAKGELSVSMNATEPVFNEKGYINIKKARHPLIDKHKVVPTDIYLGEKFNTLLITGPNTGGKTVSLKTIGLFTLMGMSGLHIPAFDNSSLSVFDEVFADIGDEQSIEQSLSTFSSHMTNIVSILSNVSDRSLVLMDELGAGTDPTEGAALAISVIKYLHNLGCRTAVTTHYSELKVFALSENGIENASCEFDVESLRPTYKLLIGVPGKSNAFAIASRLGLPDYIIAEAKNVLSREDVRFEDVITDLEVSRRALVTEQEKAQSYRAEALRLKDEIENQKLRLEKQKEKIIKTANEKASEIIASARDEADLLIKDFKKSLKKGNLSQAEKERTLLKQSAAKAYSKTATKSTHNVPEKLVKGDKVIIHSMKSSGVVINPPDKNGDVSVRAGIMTIKINISDLSLDQSDYTAPKKPEKFSQTISSKKSKNISAELDLRGLLAQEALDRLDKYIDDAYLAGLSPVTVIHGKGTGALRKAVQNYCATSPHIKGFRDGQYGEGDLGVTVIELK